MSLLSLSNACLAYGHVPLLDQANFSLESKERVGLIGRNGTGKSSLLKILAALELPDDGLRQMQLGLQIAYVPQEPVLIDTNTVHQSVTASLQHVLDWIDAYSLGQGDLHALQGQIEAADGWNWEQRVAQTLQQLELDPNRLIGHLSGGNRKRVALAKALVMRPDVLLLDEPTNHLDMRSISWLEGLLVSFKGSLVTISHDRAFLDAVTTRMVELDRGKLLSYPGNFAQYQVTKEAQLVQEATIQAKADKLLAQEEVWIRRGVEARRTRAQGRINRLQDLRTARAARRDAVGRVRLDVSSGAPSGKIVADLDQVSKHFVRADGQAPLCVLKDFSATILRGDKIGLIGPNGAGKTTLLKLILGELAPDSGSVRQGSQLSVAYFDQMRDQIDLDATLEDFISPGSEWIEIGQRRTHVKSYLNDFLFSPARANSPIRSLSGGERNRLLLARLFAQPANVLVLDEPTNDLDIDTLELLEELLQSYEGTVFLVSHDRRFLDNVVTSTLVAEGQGIWREYEGDVQDWLTQSARMQEGAKALSAPPMSSAAPAKSRSAQPRKLSYKEQQELASLPARIAALEAEQVSLEASLADGTLYAREPQQAAQLAQRLHEVEALWLAAVERLEWLKTP